MANLHLLTLPDLVQDMIMSFMTIQEQMRARLVCKTIKDMVDRKAKRLAEHLPSTVIRNYGHNTFKVFLRQRVPHLVSSIYLENDSLDIYEDVAAKEFLSLHSASITSIRIKRFFVCRDNIKQTQFFGEFNNLKYMEMDEVWVANSDSIVSRVPETFRHLKTLKVGNTKIYQESSHEIVESFGELSFDRKKNLRWHVWSMLEICDELKYLKVPTSPKNLFDNSFDECFRLLNYIRIRTRGITERGFRSQQYVMKCDINNFNCCTSSLEVLLIVGARMRIQFLNVNSKVFKRGSSFCLVGIPPRARFDYIHSFVSTSLVNRSFDYIQKLTFKASLIQNECIIGHEKGPTLFPSLKEFVVILDIGYDVKCPGALYSKTPVQPNSVHNVCFPRADQVLKFFFPDKVEYVGVHTASIIFKDPVFPNQKRASPDRLHSLPLIIQCLPNLRNLTIGGWNCKKATYFLLWNGFPYLEKLYVESCHLTASSFIGGNGNPHNPMNFRHLRDLQYLELRGMDDMPNIVRVMSETFSRMGLEPFKYLTKLDSHPQRAVWIRPLYQSQQVFDTNSTIITRSVAKANKALRTYPPAKRSKKS